MGHWRKIKPAKTVPEQNKRKDEKLSLEDDGRNKRTLGRRGCLLVFINLVVLFVRPRTNGRWCSGEAEAGRVVLVWEWKGREEEAGDRSAPR